MQSIRIIGPGRAGTSLAAALAAQGWDVVGFLGRHDDPTDAARGVDILVIATPDDVVAGVAASGGPRGATRRCCTSRGPSGSTSWRPIRAGPPCTRWSPCPTQWSARPGLTSGRHIRRER